jgi:four helix bundle protein
MLDARYLMNYRNLDVWKLAHELVIAIHEMTLTKLPKVEMFEEGAQIRRTIKSVKSNIVEGYGRRRYKQEFLRFIDYALASCDETTDHLDTLIATKSLTDSATINELATRLEELGRKLNLFLQSIERSHISEK